MRWAVRLTVCTRLCRHVGAFCGLFPFISHHLYLCLTGVRCLGGAEANAALDVCDSVRGPFLERQEPVFRIRLLVAVDFGI